MLLQRFVERVSQKFWLLMLKMLYLGESHERP